MSFGYYSPYQNNNNLYQQQMMQMQAQQQQQQNNMFIHVPSEDVARAYTVAPGGSVTFIDDNLPYCYTKTAGFNQFDVPVFRKFRLVEEKETPEQNQKPEVKQNVNPVVDDAFKKDFEDLKSRVENLENRLSNQNRQSERKVKNESTDKRQ